jgi:hypothetical protein
LNLLPRSQLLVIAAWLIIGPILGMAISFTTGEARGEEIMLATGGGLIGGGLYWLVNGTDTVLTMASALIGALMLILFYDVLTGLADLET